MCFGVIFLQWRQEILRHRDPVPDRVTVVVMEEEVKKGVYDVDETSRTELAIDLAR